MKFNPDITIRTGRAVLTGILGIFLGFVLMLFFGTFLLGWHPQTIRPAGTLPDFANLIPKYTLFVVVTGGIPVCLATLLVSRLRWVVRPGVAIAVAWLLFQVLLPPRQDVPLEEPFGPNGTEVRDLGWSLWFHHTASCVVLPLAALLGGRLGKRKQENGEQNLGQVSSEPAPEGAAPNEPSR